MLPPLGVRALANHRRTSPRRRDSRHGPSLVALLGSASLALVASCGDSLPTTPDAALAPTAPVRAVRYPALSDYSALESPEFLSTTLSVQNYGVNPTETIMGYFGRTTVLTLKLTGSAQSAGITPVGGVGVKGFGDSCASSNPWMDWDNNRFAACAYGPEITIAVHGTLRLHLSYFVNGLAPSNSAPCYGAAFSGDQTSTVPCTQWSGSFTGTATRLPVELTILPADTLITPGGAATFRLGTAPEKLGGFWDGPPPREHVASWFVPDAAEDGGVEADTAVRCGLLDNARGCRVSPQGSGTVHVIQLLNGGLKEQAAHVRVKRPRIRMTLSADSVTVGDTVFVTTEILDADRDTLYEYRWAPSGPGPILAARASLSPTRLDATRVPTGPARSLQGAGGVACLQQPAAKRCFIVPRESGVLSVRGMGDDTPLTTSKPIKVTAPKVKLECSSQGAGGTAGPAKDISVTRGDRVTCKVSRDDGQAVTARSWLFTSTDPLMPGWTNARQDGDPTSPLWEGPMVISGSVHVETAEGPADATVTVQKRDWSKLQPGTIEPVEQLVPDPPKNEHELGGFSANYENRALDSYEAISEGPNAGLDYFKSFPVQLHFKVSYNAGALRTGSSFWKMQRDRRADLGGPCARTDFTRTIQLAKRHEGFSFDDKNSHSEVILRVFVADTHAGYESAVALNGGLNPVPAANAAWDHARSESKRITDDDNPGGKNPFRLGCEYNYIPTVTYP